MSTRQFLCPRGAGGRVRCGLKVDGQKTSYHVGDSGDEERGDAPLYTIYTTGQYSGNENLDCAHYAATTLAFVNATSLITDSANGLVTVLTGDAIVIKGSTDNDGVYTVKTGGVAGQIETNEALVDEAAGAVVKIYKRAALSNNCVLDVRTGRTWGRYISNALKLGIASDGKLNWYDAATCFELHAAGADLQMIAATDTLRIVGGAGEVAAYDVGDVIDCGGFANAANNLPGYYVVSVTVNGADLDIVIDPGNNVLVNEAAGGARTIDLVCRSIFGYCAAANAVALGGYADWRIPNKTTLSNLCNMEAPTAVPGAGAFPGWPVSYVWSSTTLPLDTGYAMSVYFNAGSVLNYTKASTYYASLVRG